MKLYEMILTLPAHSVSESCIKIKINFNIFIVTLLCGASKGFMKAFKAFIKPFEGPQRSTQLSEMHVVSNWTRSKWIDDA